MLTNKAAGRRALEEFEAWVDEQILSNVPHEDIHAAMKARLENDAVLRYALAEWEWTRYLEGNCQELIEAGIQNGTLRKIGEDRYARRLD